MMKQPEELYCGKAVRKCDVCSAPIIFLWNPASKKRGGSYVPVDKVSYNGEKNFDSEIHRSHFRTCTRFQKNKTGVAPALQVLKLYARKDFSFTIPDAKGDPMKLKFKRGDVFTSDAVGKVFRSSIVNGNVSALVLPRERVVDDDGRLVERAAEFLCEMKPSSDGEVNSALLNHPMTQMVIKEFECEVV